jgi:hypothetical protein
MIPIKETAIVCDRCKLLIFGVMTNKMTGGFYTRRGGWGKFMRKNENLVCDGCVWSDPEYIKVYGKHLS